MTARDSTDQVAAILMADTKGARDVIAAHIPLLPQELARRAVDALTDAGYAIVHLPKPVHLCDRDAAWMAEDDALQIDFDRRGGIAMAYIDSGGEVWGPWTADQARQIAAALLAAADHAEQEVQP